MRLALAVVAAIGAAGAIRSPLSATSVAPAAAMATADRFAPSAGVGPRALARPARAIVAPDAATLRRLIDDPDGPSEIWLEPRRYEGDLAIRRTVALRGAHGATLRGSGTGTVVAIAADGVVLDNLTITGAGTRHTHEDSGIKAKGRAVRLSHLLVHDNLFGVNLQMCQACTIDHTAIRGSSHAEELRGDGIKLWESNDSVVTDCLVERTRDLVVWYSRRVRLERNVLRENRYGTHFMYAHDSVVRDSRVIRNVVGIFVMYSARLTLEGNVLAGARGAAGIGIGFKDSDAVAARGNWMVANTTGVYLDRTPRSPAQPVTFADNVLALNDVALRLHSSATGLTFAGNDFRDNVQTASVEGGGDALGLTFRGNYWSDYAGYDLDGDGRGDVAFLPKQLSSALLDAHPAIRFFDGSAALAMVEVVARAVPVFSSRPLLIDKEPRMRPWRAQP